MGSTGATTDRACLPAALKIRVASIPDGAVVRTYHRYTDPDAQFTRGSQSAVPAD